MQWSLVHRVHRVHAIAHRPFRPIRVETRMPLSIASPDARVSRLLRGASAMLTLGACALLATPHALRAQAPTPPQGSVGLPTEEPPIPPFANFYIAGGQAKFDVTGINSRLNTANGFFALSGDAYTTGLGFYVPVGGIIAGLEYHMLDMGFESTPAGKTDVLKAVMAQARVGFRMWTAWDLTLHADLQLGGGIATVKFRDRTGGASLAPSTKPTWDEILLKPGAESEMRGQFYFIAPGMGLDYIFLKDFKSQRGFTVGVQVASSLAPHRTAWTYGGQDVFGAPDGAPVGAQFRVTLGYGGFSIAKGKK